MKIIELEGAPQVFTLKDGKTLRLFARETKTVPVGNISNEMRIAEKMGIIAMVDDTTQIPITKKSGGKK